jgi:hypothetical protein
MMMVEQPNPFQMPATPGFMPQPGPGFAPQSPFAPGMMPQQAPFAPNMMQQQAPFAPGMMPQQAPFAPNMMPQQAPFAPNMMPQQAPFAPNMMPQQPWGPGFIPQPMPEEQQQALEFSGIIQPTQVPFGQQDPNQYLVDNYSQYFISQVQPIVENGINELVSSGLRQEMTQVALIAYLMGKGFPAQTAYQMVESWDLNQFMGIREED